MEQLDQAVFLALNFDGGSAIDHAMLAISGRLTWLPLYLLIIFLIWRRYGWRTTLFAVLLIAAAVGLADQICNLFKNGLQMLRPNHDSDVIPYMHFPLQNGVPFIKRQWFIGVAVVWAILICSSRIYIGAHYPSQVIAGIILGVVIGLIGVQIARRCKLYKPLEE